MSAYVVVSFNVLDAEKFNEYRQLAPATVKKYEGEVLAKGVTENLVGKDTFDNQVIIQFPSKDKAQNWYSSSDYQALIPNRDLAIESQFTVI